MGSWEGTFQKHARGGGETCVGGAVSETPAIPAIGAKGTHALGFAAMDCDQPARNTRHGKPATETCRELRVIR